VVWTGITPEVWKDKHTFTIETDLLYSDNIEVRENVAVNLLCQEFHSAGATFK